MLMADTMAVFFVIVGMMLAFPGLWLLCLGLWPQTVGEAAERCRRGLRLSFLVGLPVTIVVVFSTLKLVNSLGGLGKAAGIGLFCAFMLHAHIGVSGFATAIGKRLASPVDQAREWRATLRGGVVLELTYLLPILGWFIILPVSIVIGSGAAARSQIRQLRNAVTKFRRVPVTAAEDVKAEPVAGHIDGSVGAV
ncbi:MAG: hypothetical protein QOH96_132 [Blastocatellia bacterium]|nr:hypothetical protein [Blastocatellia bacterium]